jgi:hypothetical protein
MTSDTVHGHRLRSSNSELPMTDSCAIRGHQAQSNARPRRATRVIELEQLEVSEWEQKEYFELF